MTIRSARTIVATCDGCGDKQIVETRDDISGFIGEMPMQRGALGEDVAEWFACSENCIKQAVLVSIDAHRSF